MNFYPVYQDTIERIPFNRDQLPFYIGLHNVQHITPLHHHDFVELTYVYEGTGHEIINGRKHILQPGTASFLLPHHMHEVHSSSPTKPVKKFCCMFDMQLLFGSAYDSQLAEQVYKIGTILPSFTLFTGEMNERIHVALQQLYSEYHDESQLGRNSMIRAKITEVMWLFIRSAGESAAVHLDQTTTHDEIKQNGKAAPFWPLLQYVHLHYTEPMTLKQLATNFQVSVPYVSRAFKTYMGRSFLDYIHFLRIESAASMLLSTNMSIADIAAETGFESFRTFSRVFRDVKGQTPSEFRAQHK